MPVGVVSHYRPCLLALDLTIYHAFWSIATVINILLVECRRKKGGYKSGATCTETCLIIRCHSDMPSCTMQLLSGMCAGFMNSSTHVCKVLLYQARYLFCYKSSDMPTGRMPLAQGCKTCPVPSWMPSSIYHILNDVFYSITGMLQG